MRHYGPMYAQREEAGGPGPAGMSAATGDADGESAPTHYARRVTSFRGRHSALSDKQRQTWEQRWPELGADARDADGRPIVLDTDKWFGRHAPLLLEIGCGTGTSTAAMAQLEPDLDVIAVEVYKRGLGQLLSAIDGSGITNIRLIQGDGVDVLEHSLSSASLTGVRVYFPDPWPKARHQKRRLLQPDTVALIADRLKTGGILHAATDHMGYAEHIAEVGDAEPQLRRVGIDDRLPVSVARPETKYERKALAGPIVTELLWERI
jgi:tRNA (guanine-N7-)-methyltransferase